MARTTSASTSVPTPAAWLNNSACCTRMTSLGGIRVAARAPNPVVTPYTAAPLATARSTTERAGAITSSTCGSTSTRSPWRATATTSSMDSGRAPSSTRRSYAGRQAAHGDRTPGAGEGRRAWSDGRGATGDGRRAWSLMGRGQRPIGGPARCRGLERRRRRVGVPVRAARDQADRCGRRGLWPTGVVAQAHGARARRSLAAVARRGDFGVRIGSRGANPHPGVRQTGGDPSTSSTLMAEQLEPFTPPVTPSCDIT